MDEREVVASSLLESGRDGAEALERVEEAFDAVALSIELPIQPVLHEPLRLRVDDGLHPSVAHGLNEAVGIVAGVADERFSSRVREEHVGGDHLVAVALRERDVDRTTFGVGDGVEFGRETASRMAEAVFLDPPFPPDASW